MVEEFKIGDQVSWNSEGRHVKGTILKMHMRNAYYKGYTRHASNDDPQYEIKSARTDPVAMHKGASLKKASG